jgi:hypothetical protein
MKLRAFQVFYDFINQYNLTRKLRLRLMAGITKLRGLYILVLEIHACNDPSPIFSKHCFNMKYS